MRIVATRAPRGARAAEAGGGRLRLRSHITPAAHGALTRLGAQAHMCPARRPSHAAREPRTPSDVTSRRVGRPAKPKTSVRLFALVELNT